MQELRRSDYNGLTIYKNRSGKRLSTQTVVYASTEKRDNGDYVTDGLSQETGTAD